AAAPPLARRGFPDTHDADHAVRHSRHVGERDQRRRPVVDRVAVVDFEEVLFVAEDAAAEVPVGAELPGLDGGLEGHVVRTERLDGFEDHAALAAAVVAAGLAGFSCDLSVEQAPQRPQPALRVSRPSPPSRTMPATPASSSCMNAGAGGACPSSGVPLMGTNGTTNG